MLKVLLKKQIFEVFRSYFYDAKKNKARSKGAIAGYIFMFVVLMVGVLGGLFTVLANNLCSAFVPLGLDWMYFALLGLLAVFLGAFGSVFNTYSGLYLSKDNDLLLSMPIPVHTIMLSRLLGVYLMGLMYSAVLSVPAVVVYMCKTGFSLGILLSSVLYVLLIGTVLTSFFSSIQTTLTRVMDPNEYDTLLTDLVASFSNVNSAILVLSVAVLALVAFAFRKELALLDVLTLGKDQAINLGVDYDRCIRRLLLGVTLYIATATAMVGPLAFLGLIIANLSRQFLRTYRHSQLITGSVLFGMAVLIGGQLLVERVFVYSVPVSVFITVGGGVYFLYLLLTQRKA